MCLFWLFLFLSGERRFGFGPCYYLKCFRGWADAALGICPVFGAYSLFAVAAADSYSALRTSYLLLLITAASTVAIAIAIAIAVVAMG